MQKAKGSKASGWPSVITALVVTTIVAFPIYWMAVTSLKDSKELLAAIPTLFPKESHLENYVEVLQTSDMPLYFRNTALMTVGIVALQLTTCTLAAYGFAVGRFRGKRFFFGLVLCAMMLPQQVTFIPIYIAFAQLRLVNTFFALIVPEATSTFSIYLIYTAFNSVNRDLVDIGRSDGLSRLQMIWYVYLPTCSPVFITSVILSFINSWNSYFWPRIIANDRAHRVISVGLNFLKRTTISGDAIANYNVVMAGAFLSILPVLILFIVFQKHIVKNKFV